VVETSDHFGGIDVDGVAKTHENVNGRDVLPGFKHAHVFARNASTYTDFFLGKTGFQPQFAEFFAKHDRRRYPPQPLESVKNTYDK